MKTLITCLLRSEGEPNDLISSTDFCDCLIDPSAKFRAFALLRSLIYKSKSFIPSHRQRLLACDGIQHLEMTDIALVKGTDTQKNFSLLRRRKVYAGRSESRSRMLCDFCLRETSDSSR